MWLEVGAIGVVSDCQMGHASLMVMDIVEQHLVV